MPTSAGPRSPSEYPEMTQSTFLLGALVATATGLRLPSLPPSSVAAGMSCRRAVLGGAAATVASSLLLPLPALADKSKSYMTMDEYNNLKREEKKDQELYGKFESLRDRAQQTAEFDRLAADDKLTEVSQLALAWDSNIRKGVLDKANESLDSKAKEKGAAISKVILDDLKKLDKLAKAGSKDEVPATSAALRGHVRSLPSNPGMHRSSSVAHSRRMHARSTPEANAFACLPWCAGTRVRRSGAAAAPGQVRIGRLVSTCASWMMRAHACVQCCDRATHHSRWCHAC